MDETARRHETAGAAAAPIALPAVAWQTTEPPEPPEAEPMAEPTAGPVRGAAPALPVPETETRAETQAEAEAQPDPAPDHEQTQTAPRPRRTGRIPKPMIAAAATSGVVLMGLPLLLAQLGGGGSGPGPAPSRPAGFNQPESGPDGFVPGADQPANRALPGTLTVPGAATGSPSPAPAKGGGNKAAAPPETRPGGTGRQTDVRQSPAAKAPRTAATRQATRPAAKAPAPTPKPTAPAKKTYKAVAGSGCGGGGTGYSRYGYWTNGKEGWLSSSSGGACGGFDAMPMSGSATRDSGNYVLWTFRTGAVTTGSCQVSVFIPNVSDIKLVGGKPSLYTVRGAAAASGTVLGSFAVDQPSNRGAWVSGGTYRISGGALSVLLNDRGKDWTGSSTKTYAHHAASAVRVTCTS
ncbi:hypothetical protein [Streptomyces sp. NPDC094032]|uniref:hypothetical protein n=1 Tax=Streptomyces sp. NPDC094032 TaxID=3155308 RepID=UPI003331A3B1